MELNEIAQIHLQGQITLASQVILFITDYLLLLVHLLLVQLHSVVGVMHLARFKEAM
jgi:hypothetical protein